MSNALLLSFAVLLILTKYSHQCATNGLCGGSPYCPSRPVTPTSCSCQSSYSCGSYGCYRARARSSKTLQSNEKFWERSRLAEISGSPSHLSAADRELASLSQTAAHLKRSAEGERVDPNRVFYECCQDRNLPDACLAKCHFGAYNRDQLTRMYFKQDACPLEAMKELQFCAAQGRDHRECCARNGVTTTLAGAKCLLFCDQTPGRVTQLDLSFTPCFERFENMKACFYHDITRFYTLRR